MCNWGRRKTSLQHKYQGVWVLESLSLSSPGYRDVSEQAWDNEGLFLMQDRVMDSLSFASHCLFNFCMSFCLILYLLIHHWVQLTSLQMKYIPEMLYRVLFSTGWYYNSKECQPQMHHDRHISEPVRYPRRPSCWVLVQPPYSSFSQLKASPKVKQVNGWPSTFSYSKSQLIPKCVGNSHCFPEFCMDKSLHCLCSF